VEETEVRGVEGLLASSRGRSGEEVDEVEERAETSSGSEEGIVVYLFDMGAG
jgi:hypothetical protein